jgi:predicted dehydrogenase
MEKIMLRLGVIGLGTIFPKQVQAMKNFPDDIALAAVYDIQPEKLQNAATIISDLGVASQIQFCKNLESFLKTNVDAVLIAVPPHAHEELAKACLLAEKDVLLEKPAVLSIEKLKELYHLADTQKKILHVAYHSSFAVDLTWYNEHRNQLMEIYSLGATKKICCAFFDPYMKNGEVIPSKHFLAGSYIDSGVNELSVCERLTELSDFVCTFHREEREQNEAACTFASRTEYQSNNQQIILETGWDRGLNQKTTLLEFEHEDIKILLDHSNQQVILIKDDIEKVLYKEDSMERLLRHYTGVFKDFLSAEIQREDNRTKSLIIHEKLLCHHKMLNS